MRLEDDKREPETWREILARRHRRQRRLRSVLTLAALLCAGVLAVAGWIAYVMTMPPRPRVSRSERATLGLFVEPAPEGGLQVLASVPPASRAGLRPGDRIVAVEGEAVSRAGDLAIALARAGPATPVRIEARRPEPGGDEGMVWVDVTAESRPVSPADLGLPYEEVAWPGSAGTVRGWYVPPPEAGAPAPAILYGHGNASDRTEWLEAAWYGRREGFAQLLFDFSGRGESDGRGVTLGLREAEDLRAGMAWLERRPEVDASRLTLVGRSMGAVAALLAAAAGAPVRALVLDSPFADLAQLVDEALGRHFLPPWPLRLLAFQLARAYTGYDPSDLRPVEAIRRLRAPILLIHGTADRVVPFHHAERLAQAAAGPVQLVRLEGHGHNDPRPPEVRQAMLDFLKRHSAAPRGTP